MPTHEKNQVQYKFQTLKAMFELKRIQQAGNICRVLRHAPAATCQLPDAVTR